jgi:DNA replication and repair protein RecF
MELDGGVNVVTGANAAGKTTLLEAMFYLGRGRSFRRCRPAELVREGLPGFTLSALAGQAAAIRLGIEYSGGESRTRVGGRNGATSAELAVELPVQAIDPAVHELVTGSPVERRRFIDWGVFHVEHLFLESWRRYRRALKQRNALLKQSRADQEQLDIWTGELCEAGLTVDAQRRAYVDAVSRPIQSVAADLLELDVDVSYAPGWRNEYSLQEALERSAVRDKAMQSTQAGPHRADLRLVLSGTPARSRVSRGQQKLLGAAMIIGQIQQILSTKDMPVLLLVDDPAAELDKTHLARLTGALAATPAQLVLTALDPQNLPVDQPDRVFHVEHGGVTVLL